MSCKRPASSPAASTPQRKRASYGLDIKLEVIRRKNAGVRSIDISTAMGIPDSTIHTILKNAKEIEAKGKNLVGHSAVNITRQRSEIMETMERRLATWIQDLYSNNTPVSLALIQAKALNIHGDLCKQLGEDETRKEKNFNASRGWFPRFQKRHGFKNVKVLGEIASADTVAADKFPNDLREIIREGGYTAKQVFNVDETGLYYKRMPNRTYIAKEEKQAKGFKASKDRMTLLLGANANRDKKLKLLLIHRSENPRCFKNVVKSTLPVIWKKQRKSWITKLIFQEWFVENLIPELKAYCERENMAFKILLIMDNASAHILPYEELSDNIKVIFMPPNTTSIMQPMDQGVISCFKANYLKETFTQLIEATDASDEMTVMQFWKEFDILKCVKIIGNVWKSLSSRLLNSCWKKMYPEAVHSFEGFDSMSLKSVHTEIATLAKSAGFTEVESEDIEEVLASHDEPLTNEELEELENESPEELRSDATTDEELQRTLSVKGLRESLNGIEGFLRYFTENDPNFERAMKFERTIKDAMGCYKKVLEEKIHQGKQPTIKSFFKVKTPKEPEPSPISPKQPKKSSGFTFFTSWKPMQTTSSSTSSNSPPSSPIATSPIPPFTHGDSSDETIARGL